MKKVLLLTIVASSLFIGVKAQEVIAVSGNYVETANGSLSWTIGEPIVETVSDGTNTLTQGFQQSKLTITAIDEKEIAGFEINVFPNPASDYLSVEVITDKQKDLEISLFDLNGKIILQKQMTGNKQTVNMQNYSPATYILKVTENNENLKTYQIIKH